MLIPAIQDKVNERNKKKLINRLSLSQLVTVRDCVSNIQLLEQTPHRKVPNKKENYSKKSSQ